MTQCDKYYCFFFLCSLYIDMGHTRRHTKRRQVGGKHGKGRRKAKRVLTKLNRGLKKTKIISRAGKALGNMGVPYASKVGSVAGQLGYGRKRRAHGAMTDQYGAYINNPMASVHSMRVKF